MSRRLAARLAAFAVAAGAAVLIGINVNSDVKPPQQPWPWEVIVGIAIIFGLIILFLLPYITVLPYRWVRDQIRTAEVSDLIAAAIGLVVGLIIAALLAIPLSQLKFWNLGSWLPSLAALLFAYLGVATAVLRKDDFGRLFSIAFGGRAVAARDEEDRREEDDRDEGEEERGRLRFGKRAKPAERILVDTSAIIDGRIADISQTGFIRGRWSCRASCWRNCSTSPTPPTACAATVDGVAWTCSSGCRKNRRCRSRSRRRPGEHSSRWTPSW